MAKPRPPRRQASPALTRRTNRRLARVRLERPGALPGVRKKGYTVREAVRVKRVDTRMRKRQAAQQKVKAQRQRNKPQPFDPLAPVTAKNSQQELNAQTRLEFGERERAMRQEEANQAQATANTGTYYDDYRQALREATGRINAANAEATEQSQARVDQAHAQDTAASAQRDAAASEQAAKLGRGPVVTREGQQAAEGARSQGNQRTAEMRQQAAADTSLMEKRGATAVLAKGQALARETARTRQLGTERRQIARDKGDFKVAARGKLRQSEREWSAIQKEFGLEKMKARTSAQAQQQDARLERQKLAAQKIVARIYASADKAGARAQIRVAQLQLRKGQISKHQFRTIRNIYEGLPEKGVAPGAKGPGGKPGPGSGPDGALAPWERDKVDIALRSLRAANARPDEKRAMIDRLVKRGNVPARLARIAWARYIKTQRGPAPVNPKNQAQNPRGFNG